MIRFLVTREAGNYEISHPSPMDFEAVFVEARRLMSEGATYVQILSGEVSLLCMQHSNVGHLITGSPLPAPRSWSTKTWSKTKNCKNGVVIFSRWVAGKQVFESHVLWRERELRNLVSLSQASAEDHHSNLAATWGHATREELDNAIEGAPRGPNREEG